MLLRHNKLTIDGLAQKAYMLPIKIINAWVCDKFMGSAAFSLPKEGSEEI